MRRMILFPCAGDTLAGTLDEAPGSTGLLIVSGGNEIRIGAHRGMALLAARLAARGIPVFRFDRRGIGDSTGVNRGFDHSRDDIIAAATAFRAAAPRVTRLAAFGNCDAATALAFFHGAAGIDTLILANPWVIEAVDDLPPAATIRARYAQRLRDPATWLRLIRGGVDLRKVFRGLRKVSTARLDSAASLAVRLKAALRDSADATIILAARDATAIAFAAGCGDHGVPTHRIDTASHSFARGEDQAGLETILLEILDPD